MEICLYGMSLLPVIIIMLRKSHIQPVAKHWVSKLQILIYHWDKLLLLVDSYIQCFSSAFS